MSRKHKQKIEFRYYRMPEDTYLLPLLGENWVQEYGVGIDYLHFHNYMEIGYCYYGSGTISFANDRFEFHDGTITVIAKNCPHTTDSTRGTKSKWEYLYIDEIGFMNRFFGNQLKREDLDVMIRRINSGPLVLNETEAPALARHVRELLEICRAAEPYHKLESEGILGALLAEIARYDSAMDPKDAKEKEFTDIRYSPYVSTAMEYMRRHYKEEIRMDVLAETCCISETQLRRAFQEEVKIGLLKYLNRIRIEQACILLRKSSLSVVEIAYQCGFSTLATFNRNFRSLMGVSPSQWRNNPENYEQILHKFQVHNEEGW